ncbi:MAG: hypothetical protein UIM53_02945 [Acutalibacteraceae bacterium]|nr:hypothetical protein [Acutalibacteraceae bacterium]
MKNLSNTIRNALIYILFFAVFGTLGAVLGVALANPVMAAVAEWNSEPVCYDLPNDVYAYDLEDKFDNETSLYDFTETERNVYYRLRNMFIAVGKGESDVMAVKYMLPENTEYQDVLDVNKVFHAFRNNYPYFEYWRGHQSSTKVFDDVNTLVISISAAPEFEVEGTNGEKIDTEKTKAAYDRTMKTVNEIIENNEGLSDYEKVVNYISCIKYMTDYDYDFVKKNEITENYNPESYIPHTMLNAFDNDESTKVVCSGFAQAFQFLCDNTEFTGNVKAYILGGDNHAWNVITMDDGLTYSFDLTYLDGRDISSSKYLMPSTFDGAIHTMNFVRPGWVSDGTVTTYSRSIEETQAHHLCEKSIFLAKELDFTDETYYKAHIQVKPDPNAVPYEKNAVPMD